MIKTLLFAVNMVHNLSLGPEKKAGLILNCSFVCESETFVCDMVPGLVDYSYRNNKRKKRKNK
jgi:hypothetical protein